MILIYALIFIVFEAVTEGLLKRFNKAEWLFANWLQWVTAIFLFGVYFILAYNFNGYYVPTWKLITGFIGVRFLIFDFIYNITSGLPLMFYGTTKLYDRIMAELGGWGLMVKFICGIMGIVFLLGID